MNKSFNIANLIIQKAEYWITQEKKKSQSVVGTLIKHIEKINKLREPQKEAIEVYLWLKFIGNNQKLADIIKRGLLYDEEQAKQYDNFYTFGNNYTTQFLNQFFHAKLLLLKLRRLTYMYLRYQYISQLNQLQLWFLAYWIVGA